MHFLSSILVGNVCHLAQSFQRTFIRWTKPTSETTFVGAVMGLAKTRPELVAENAFLRQQLVVLHRQVKHPTFKAERALLAALVRNWKQLLLIAQPDTLLRWHRQGFRLIGNIVAFPILGDLHYHYAWVA